MYDTEKRVALVKKRMAEHHRRQVQRSIRRLSALCLLLFLALVGAAGMVQGQPMDVAGMYGAILLHEGAGGYVLVAVISFTVAVVITVLCIKFGKKGQQVLIRQKKIYQSNGRRKINEEAKETNLCKDALHLPDAFFGSCAGIGSGNGRSSGQSRTHFRVLHLGGSMHS